MVPTLLSRLKEMFCGAAPSVELLLLERDGLPPADIDDKERAKLLCSVNSIA